MNPSYTGGLPGNVDIIAGLAFLPAYKAGHPADLPVKPMMRVVYKVWLDCGGKAFGDGPCDLLRGVEQTGSLHQAAADMSMSYSKAWRLIQTMEKRLGFTLIERKIGGASGGGSKITPEAKRLMSHYTEFREDLELSLNRIYRKHFHCVKGCKKR
jgi:molybdate transport system regulatory protein